MSLVGLFYEWARQEGNQNENEAGGNESATVCLQKVANTWFWSPVMFSGSF